MSKHIEWIKRNKDFLKIYHIEQVLEMPEGTLKKFVDGRRDLPINWHKSVEVWVKNFKKN